MGKTLDVITIGRSSVDLYGDQVGGRLEDMGSFSKYIGGSPTNIACGAARLGLRTAVITAVGDEHMGRFIREQLAREGVDTRGVKVDRERLTALVLLGIRDDSRFPLIFYRENCADMGLTEDDIDEGFIAEARAVLATGTHLSHPRTEAAVLRALNLARKHVKVEPARWYLLPPCVNWPNPVVGLCSIRKSLVKPGFWMMLFWMVIPLSLAAAPLNRIGPCQLYAMLLRMLIWKTPAPLVPSSDKMNTKLRSSPSRISVACV